MCTPFLGNAEEKSKLSLFSEICERQSAVLVPNMHRMCANLISKWQLGTDESSKLGESVKLVCHHEATVFMHELADSWNGSAVTAEYRPCSSLSRTAMSPFLDQSLTELSLMTLSLYSRHKLYTWHKWRWILAVQCPSACRKWMTPRSSQLAWIRLRFTWSLLVHNWTNWRWVGIKWGNTLLVEKKLCCVAKTTNLNKLYSYHVRLTRIFRNPHSRAGSGLLCVNIMSQK